MGFAMFFVADRKLDTFVSMDSYSLGGWTSHEIFAFYIIQGWIWLV